MVKTINFKLERGGKLSPFVPQEAGAQGSHNIVEVRIDITEYVKQVDSEDVKYRMQFIDGAGGFHSSGFLQPENDLGDIWSISCELENSVTNAGGIASVHFVASTIFYDGEKAIESEIFITEAGKIAFSNSGVGSPSEYQYRRGMSNALLNAEIFAGRAESASNTAKEHRDKAEEFKKEADNSASLAAETKTEIEILKDWALSYSETALGASQAATNAKKEAIKSKENAEVAARVSAQSATDAAAKLEELKNTLSDYVEKIKFEDLVTIVNKILEFLNLSTGDTYLVSSDGYILQDINGLYLTTKESN